MDFSVTRQETLRKWLMVIFVFEAIPTTEKKNPTKEKKEKKASHWTNAACLMGKEKTIFCCVSPFFSLAQQWC